MIAVASSCIHIYLCSCSLCSQMMEFSAKIIQDDAQSKPCNAGRTYVIVHIRSRNAIVTKLVCTQVERLSGGGRTTEEKAGGGATTGC